VRDQLQAQFEQLASVKANAASSSADLAAAYGDTGKLLLAAEAFPDAEPYFVNARTLAAGDIRWAYDLAHVCRLEGRLAQAAALFEEVLRARPDDVAALVWLGNVQLDQGRLDEAERTFAAAMTLGPRVAAAHLGAGRAAFARGEYARAIERLEWALMLDPRAAAAHYPLAMAYRATGQPAKAEVHLRQRGGAEIAPPDPLMDAIANLLRSPVAHESRGDRAFAAADYAAAVTHFRRGLELAPDNVPMRQKLATALSLTGDVDGAVAELQEVLRRAPGFAEAHYSLGVLLLGNDQLDLAIDRFKTAVRGDPTYVPARLQLANTLRRRGRFDEALGHYSDVVARDPRIGEARFGEAVTLVRLGRHALARERLVDAVRLFPGQRDFATALSRVYATAPDADVRSGGAARELAQGLVGGGRTIEALETMAMALAEQGDFDAAVMWQREAIAFATRTGSKELAVRMTDNLTLYTQGQPCRTAWRDDPRWESF
jgi:tetratricopeptide (TPR) repeat protein